MENKTGFNEILAQAELRACQTATFNVVQTALIHNAPIAVGSAGKVILLDAKTLSLHYASSLQKSIS